MKNFKKLFVICFVLLITLALTGCDELTSTTNGNKKDTQNTLNIGSKLANNQPTPTDIEYSLERYNLIRRAYWVNGQREKAVTLPSPVTLPLGYIILFNANTTVAQFTVEGKVSSLRNYLTPISEAYEVIGCNDNYSDGITCSNVDNKWLADTDGTYGDNSDGIFFFTTDGKYVEWNGEYLYSDLPIFVEKPVIEVK